MEIIQKKVVIKLDKEERDNLIATIDLIGQMHEKVPCCDGQCPFKEACDLKSNMDCLLREIRKDLIYINNHCD